MSEKVRVAIIGAGRTGTPLLKDFLQRPFIEVVGVADENAASAGVLLAQDRGIFYTQDAGAIAEMGTDVDIIVEVSGDPTVKSTLKDAFQAQGNRHTIILHDLVARLLMSVVEDSETLIESYHPGDAGIG